MQSETFDNLQSLLWHHIGTYQLWYIVDIKEKVCDCPPACFKIDYDVKVTMAEVADGMQTIFNSRLQENTDFLSVW